MAPTRVGIIGGGIGGPAMAIFLKQKGYDPVIFERAASVKDRGLVIVYVMLFSLCTFTNIGFGHDRPQHNGLKVLSKIPGLKEFIGGYQLEEWQFFSAIPEDKGYLGSLIPPPKERTEGHTAVCTRRHVLQERLIQFAEKSGIPVRWEHQLESLEQDDEHVTVTFTNGVKETFSFVIGCDGIRSSTRKAIFGEEPPPAYTGISMVRGPEPS